MYRFKFKNVENINEYVDLIKVFIKPSHFEITNSDIKFDGREVLDENEGNTENEFIFDFKNIEINSMGLGDVSPKNQLKQQIYKALKEETGMSPPWGILTGIRPAKLFRELVEKKGSIKSAADILRTQYYVSEDRISLLIKIHNIQKSFYTENREKVGIYVGIPFCPSRCLYCSFPSNQVEYRLIKSYLQALSKEILYVGTEMRKKGLTAESIYIGGGTPTTLTSVDMDMILKTIIKNIPFESLEEFTCEAGRPDTINTEILKILKDNGVSRISINPQTMKNDTLVLLGREHTAHQTEEAFELAKYHGFESINMDLIIGLPEESLKDFNDTLRQVLRFRPDNITIHSLALKRSSRLKEHDAEFTYLQGEATAKMLDLSRKLLDSEGYTPYYLYRQKQMSGNLENTGYCLPGKESCYNIKIMEENQTIIALGAGGISKVYFPQENRLERVANVTNFEIYINRIDEMLNRKEKGIFQLV